MMISLDDHCKVLGISPTKKNDISAIKTALTIKLREPYTYRNDRIRYNLAFEELCNSLFNTHPSP